MADRSREQHPDQWRNTPRYLRLRARVLDEEPLCVLCLARGVNGVVATEMDHTRPVVLGGARWDRNNVRGLCTPCHIKKSATEKQALTKPASLTCIHGTISTNDCEDCEHEHNRVRLAIF